MYAKAGEMLPLPLLLLPKTNHYKKLYHRKTQPTPNYPHSTYTHTYTHMKLYTRTHTQRGGAHFQLPLFEFGIFHIHIPYSIFHIPYIPVPPAALDFPVCLVVAMLHARAVNRYNERNVQYSTLKKVTVMSGLYFSLCFFHMHNTNTKISN